VIFPGACIPFTGGVPLPNKAKSSVAWASMLVLLQKLVPKVPSFFLKAYTKYSSLSLNQYPVQVKVLYTVCKTACFSFDPFHHCETSKVTIILGSGDACCGSSKYFNLLTFPAKTASAPERAPSTDGGAQLQAKALGAWKKVRDKRIKKTTSANADLIFRLLKFIRIKKFSSPKIKIWFEPMFFSEFFCGFQRCGSAAFPNFRGGTSSPPQAAKCVRTNSRILHHVENARTYFSRKT